MALTTSHPVSAEVSVLKLHVADQELDCVHVRSTGQYITVFLTNRLQTDMFRFLRYLLGEFVIKNVAYV